MEPDHTPSIGAPSQDGMIVIKSRSDEKHGASMFSNCTSLRSSRLNLTSVASELEYNKENASIDSIEVKSGAIKLDPVANAYSSKKHQE